MVVYTQQTAERIVDALSYGPSKGRTPGRVKQELRRRIYYLYGEGAQVSAMHRASLVDSPEETSRTVEGWEDED